MSGVGKRLDRLTTVWPLPPPAWAMRAAKRAGPGWEPIDQRLYAEMLVRDEPPPPDLIHLTDADLDALAAELAPTLGYPAAEVLTDLQNMREDGR